MRALLVEPKPKRTWGKNNQHVGLLRIGNWLQQNGNEVQYLRQPELPNWQPDEIYVTSMFTYDYPQVWDAVRFYKNLYPNAVVKLGGIYATLCPDHARRSGADEVMIGRHPEACHYAPDPTLLPYKQTFAYLFTSYGCDRACTYCATHLLFGKGIRQTEPEQVLDEIMFLGSRGFREVWFGDDNILYNAEEHIQPLCELIARHQLGIRFYVPGGMSAKDFDADTARMMKDAGFKEFSFALESTESDVRIKMGRAHHSTQEDIVHAVELLEGLGYIREDIACYFLVGLPYQTLPDMVETLCFLISLGIEARPMRLTPIPGTIEWKHLGLEQWDLADLNYSTFVAPDQDNFTHEDLRAIVLTARAFTIQRRYIDWLAEKDKMSKGTTVPGLFRKVLSKYL